MKHFLRVLLLVSMLGIFCAACGGSSTGNGNSTPTATSTTLNVFAAASLKESFTVIATKYHQAHPNITVKTNFAGSQILETQIASGASADIFASADIATMNKANSAGLVNPSQIFARNKLVVIVPTSNPAGITTLKDLAKKGVKIVMAANTVPVGKYTLQVLANMAKSPDYGPAYEQAVKANVVSQETDVKAVVQKVVLGEADAGFVYLTDVTTQASSKVKPITIPDTFNVIARYPIATVKSSQHAADAQAFMQYILSADGQSVLATYHFIPVNP